MYAIQFQRPGAQAPLRIQDLLGDVKHLRVMCWQKILARSRRDNPARLPLSSLVANPPQHHNLLPRGASTNLGLQGDDVVSNAFAPCIIEGGAPDPAKAQELEMEGADKMAKHPGSPESIISSSLCQNLQARRHHCEEAHSAGLRGLLYDSSSYMDIENVVARYGMKWDAL